MSAILMIALLITSQIQVIPNPKHVNQPQPPFIGPKPLIPPKSPKATGNPKLSIKERAQQFEQKTPPPAKPISRLHQPPRSTKVEQRLEERAQLQHKRQSVGPAEDPLHRIQKLNAEKEMLNKEIDRLAKEHDNLRINNNLDNQTKEYLNQLSKKLLDLEKQLTKKEIEIHNFKSTKDSPFKPISERVAEINTPYTNIKDIVDDLTGVLSMQVKITNESDNRIQPILRRYIEHKIDSMKQSTCPQEDQVQQKQHLDKLKKTIEDLFIKKLPENQKPNISEYSEYYDDKFIKPLERWINGSKEPITTEIQTPNPTPKPSQKAPNIFVRGWRQVTNFFTSKFSKPLTLEQKTVKNIKKVEKKLKRPNLSDADRTAYSTLLKTLQEQLKTIQSEPHYFNSSE